jgi:hypothetical protein
MLFVFEVLLRKKTICTAKHIDRVTVEMPGGGFLVGVDSVDHEEGVFQCF